MSDGRSWPGAAAAICLAFVLTVPSQAAAQQAEPGVVAVRYFKCSLDGLGDAVRMLNTDWRRAAQTQMDQGTLLDYGILTHFWGDEWNLVDYFVAPDIATFHESFGAMFSQFTEAAGDGALERFAALCPEHKDNIYNVVSPPGGGM